MKNLLTGCIILSLLGNFALALIMVWSTTQRTGVAYNLKEKREEVAAAANLYAKLSVERDRLLSPYTLNIKARQLGLRSAEQNQKRFLQ